MGGDKTGPQPPPRACGPGVRTHGRSLEAAAREVGRSPAPTPWPPPPTSGEGERGPPASHAPPPQSLGGGPGGAAAERQAARAERAQVNAHGVLTPAIPPRLVG